MLSTISGFQGLWTKPVLSIYIYSKDTNWAIVLMQGPCFQGIRKMFTMSGLVHNSGRHLSPLKAAPIKSQLEKELRSLYYQKNLKQWSPLVSFFSGGLSFSNHSQLCFSSCRHPTLARPCSNSFLGLLLLNEVFSVVFKAICSSSVLCKHWKILIRASLKILFVHLSMVSDVCFVDGN